MKKATVLNNPFIVMLFVLLLSNFSAFAQKTNIWLVCHAEKNPKADALSDTGQVRATDLMNTLKHKGIEVIYVTPEKVSLQTANPLAVRDKILPRIYTDSVQKFANIIMKNFAGKNVLIVADYKTILHFISAFGASSPFDSLDEGDYDQMFCITIKSADDVDSSIRYYGKTHHVTPIPQSYLIDNFQPGVPGH
jgi:2,3-bisphosphoglycerate-dependent phosphoglycerate mutase